MTKVTLNHDKNNTESWQKKHWIMTKKTLDHDKNKTESWQKQNWTITKTTLDHDKSRAAVLPTYRYIHLYCMRPHRRHEATTHCSYVPHTRWEYVAYLRRVENIASHHALEESNDDATHRLPLPHGWHPPSVTLRLQPHFFSVVLCVIHHRIYSTGIEHDVTRAIPSKNNSICPSLDYTRDKFGQGQILHVSSPYLYIRFFMD